MRKRNKILVGLIATPVALAALIQTYIFIGGIEWGDWTIPNEAELRLDVREVPDEENAYVALQALTNLYHVAEGAWDSEEVSDGDIVRWYGREPSLDDDEKALAVRCDPSAPERAARIVADHADFFEGFRAALSRKGFWDKDAETELAKENERREEKGLLPQFEVMVFRKHLIRFVQLVLLKAQIELERGDAEAAVSSIGAAHALGQMLSANSCCLVDSLVANLIEKMAYGKMCDAVARFEVPDEAANRFEGMIALSDSNAQDCFERAMKAEYTSETRSEEFCFGRGADGFIDAMERDRSDHGFRDCKPYRTPFLERLVWKWPGVFRFAFHRREMRFYRAKRRRAMMAHEMFEVWDYGEQWWRLLPGGYGRRIMNCLMPLVEDYFKESCLDRARTHLTLAAAKWRRTHDGANPPTLDALVPDCLAAVPADPWAKDGHPLQYDAASGVCWSVGRDGDYDYRTLARGRPNRSDIDSVKRDTQRFAFRLDAQPITFTESEEKCLTAGCQRYKLAARWKKKREEQKKENSRCLRRTALIALAFVALAVFVPLVFILAAWPAAKSVRRLEANLSWRYRARNLVFEFVFALMTCGMVASAGFVVQRRFWQVCLVSGGHLVPYYCLILGCLIAGLLLVMMAFVRRWRNLLRRRNATAGIRLTFAQYAWVHSAEILADLAFVPFALAMLSMDGVCGGCRGLLGVCVTLVCVGAACLNFPTRRRFANLQSLMEKRP